MQVNKESFTLFHLQNRVTVTVTPESSMSTSRLAIGKFALAEKTLQNGVVEVMPKSIFRPSPIMVIHQMYKAEGGLSEIEVRVLTEMGYGAGAREVFIWQGAPLTEQQLWDGVYKGNAE